ncbi:MAG TPA: serine/threonine-protein kinase [Kofleriaceae bacterium]|nr:serine/threonine-protein kinase [Kofleriaceae bacterium]
MSAGDRPPKDLAEQTTAEERPARVAEDGDVMSAQIADARPVESPALVLARARIAGALFGDAVGLGRFRVLERLGGGGMGVVYAAYDPELDRGVALKTVHVPRIGRDIALAEAKALARLAHPNVVPVFDVGASGDHVYIVMELVRGETLRAWVQGKPPPEILDVYRQAGQALAAAHAAGLVHRDFKPDNAIVGTDGRVRVVDFGLACEAAGEPSSEASAEISSPVRVGGTPRYMAPEQTAGAPATPAADQYSFGVSLGEALRGDPDRAVPRWLELVVERATAADPGARFASMQALLRALGADPARVRRRGLIAAAVAGVVAAAFAIGRSGLIAADEPCSGGERLIAAAWSPTARQLGLARIAALSPYGIELAASLRTQLDDLVRRWSTGHRAACLAHRRGEQSAALLDRRMACLDRGRAALGALADVVVTADAAALPGVARAARAVPDPDACADAHALEGDVDPASPALAAIAAGIAEQVARARIQLAAGHADTARSAAAAAAARARAFGHRPLLAEALLVEGHALMADDRDAAAARLRDAATTGFASGSAAYAIEAWARRAWLIGTSAQPEAALAGLDVVDALASRTSSAFARALLHNNVASVELGRGHRAAARAMLERALDDARRVTGPGALELVLIRINTALALDEPERRDALLADAHAELVRLLGEDHPDALLAQSIRVKTTVVSFARAAELLDAVCRRREIHVWLAPVTAVCWVELADLRAELGDRTAAAAALDRAAVLGSDRNDDTPEAAGYRLLWRGDPAAAARRFAAALDAFPAAPGEPWYVGYTRARLSLGLGRAQAALGQPASAIAPLERSIAVLEPLARDRPAVAFDRRLGRARAELARARAAVGAPPEPTRALASAALGWLRSAGAPASELAALEPLTAGSPR